MNASVIVHRSKKENVCLFLNREGVGLSTQTSHFTFKKQAWFVWGDGEEKKKRIKRLSVQI